MIRPILWYIHYTNGIYRGKNRVHFYDKQKKWYSDNTDTMPWKKLVVVTYKATVVLAKIVVYSSKSFTTSIVLM